MIRKEHAAHGNAEGFSLIEVMVVLVIIGMMVGLVAINVLPKADEARQKAAFTQIKIFEDALEMYRLDHGKYPDADVGLSVLVKPDKSGNTYLKDRTLPKDPWGYDFHYQRPGGDGYPYDIASYGADGAPGGDGLNVDISNHKSSTASNEEEE